MDTQGLPTDSSSLDSCSPAATCLTKRKKRPIPRKGHTKSRNGCLNCKKRKVKCQETLPECSHCQRVGLRCEYPSGKDIQRKDILPAPPTTTLQFAPTTTFTLDDMRFFQHFLIKAYPPLPIHGEGIWRDVAQISHGFDYLLHSMLGLAVSSLEHSLALSASSPTSYSSAALSHRIRAIRLLNASLSRSCSCPEEGTARYAAMMALTFQSSYMADGMLDFVSMTRGCSVVAQTAMEGAFAVSPFGLFSRESHVDVVRRLGPKAAWDTDGEAAAFDDEQMAEFLEGLGTLRALCGGRCELEDELLSRVEKAVMLARWDCVGAFDQITLVYALLGNADHDEFLTCVDPDNFPAQMLLVYFFLVEYTVASRAMKFMGSSFDYRRATTKLWIDNLAAKLPKEYEPYMEWPVKLAKSLLP